MDDGSRWLKGNEVEVLLADQSLRVLMRSEGNNKIRSCHKIQSAHHMNSQRGRKIGPVEI